MKSPPAHLFTFSAALLVLAALAGCAKRQEYQVVLGERESIEASDPVYLDGIRVGRVAGVGEEGGERVANLSLEPGALGDRVRKGIFRVAREDRRVDLIGREVEAEAPPLAKGSRIPTRSRLNETILRYATWANVLAGAAGLALCCLVFALLKSRLGFFGLVASAIISAVASYFLSPHLVPKISRLYGRFPPPGVESQSEPAATASIDPAPRDGADAIGDALGTISELFVNRPDPKVLAFCATFVTVFLFVNLVLLCFQPKKRA